MTQEGKIRVAFGLFDELPRLCQAIDALRAAGAGAGDTILLGDAIVLSNQFASMFTLDEARPGDIPPLTLVRGKRTHRCTSQARLKNGGRQSSAANALERLVSWLTSGFPDDLNVRLAEGACVLLVLVSQTSAAVEHQACEILLRYSSTTVQIHDVPGSI